MIFIGFLLNATTLKKGSDLVIKELNEAGIRTLMVTGDSMLTSVKVGYDCGIIGKTQKVYIGDIHKSKIGWKTKQYCDFQSSFNIKENDTIDLYKMAPDDVKFFHAAENQYRNLKSEPLSEIQSISNVRVEERGLSSNPEGNTKLIFSPRKEQRRESMVDGMDPWKNDRNSYVIALTETALEKFFNQTPPISRACAQDMLNHLKIVSRATIFGKSMIIDKIKQYQVSCIGMCGDGSNDQAALDNSDVGIALIRSEANISSSLCTSNATIACIPEIITEGRQALATSFENFKFMVIYSTIQLINFIILIYHNTDMTSMQYLYQDLLLMLPTIIFMSWQMKIPKLSNQFPKPRFINSENLILIGGILVANLVGSITVIYFLARIEGYQPTVSDRNGQCMKEPNDDNTTLYLFGCIEIVTAILVFNIESKYRKPLYKNPLLFSWLVLCVFSVSALLFKLISNFARLFEVC
jgi:magnesium-transporting ATPase (P-type)